MKLYLAASFVFMLFTAQAQKSNLPSWFMNAYHQKGLDKKYAFATFLKPAYYQADFNGDASPDMAVLVIDKQTKKKGILLVHSKTNEYFIFGAGRKFGVGNDEYDWLDKWTLYTKKTAQVTQFNTKTGDITGSKTIKLVHPGLLVEADEDGAMLAGGIIYWNGKEYTWIQQGE